MGTIAMIFNTRSRVGGGIAVASDVIAFFDDQDRLTQLAGDAFSNDGAQ